jgi:hypothetical protein
MDETNEEQTIRPKRRRIYRKRTVFRGYPHPAIPVRGLWEQATDEEKQTAHRQCMAILEYWLGKRSKQEIAGRLGVPSLRVWQMSQQALSGMLAGLLRQPKKRAKVTLPPACPEEDPKRLTEKIRELEKKLAHTEDLVRVLKDLPWSRTVERETEGDSDGRRKPSRRTTHRTASAKRRGVPVSPGSETAGRPRAAARDAARREAAPGTESGPDEPHAEELDEAGRGA